MEPPGPIPNPEVKRRSADDSGTIGPVKVGRCQSNARPQPLVEGGHFFCPDLTKNLRGNAFGMGDNAYGLWLMAYGLWHSVRARRAPYYLIELVVGTLLSWQECVRPLWTKP